MQRKTEKKKTQAGAKPLRFSCDTQSCFALSTEIEYQIDIEWAAAIRNGSLVADLRAVLLVRLFFSLLFYGSKTKLCFSRLQASSEWDFVHLP